MGIGSAVIGMRARLLELRNALKLAAILGRRLFRRAARARLFAARRFVLPRRPPSFTVSGSAGLTVAK